MNTLLKPAVLSISLLIIITASAVSPALADIRDSFAGQDGFLLKMIITLPSLIIIPFSLLSGKISHLLNKRKTIIIALIIYIFGGIGGGFATNMYNLLIFRAIIGIGMGILTPFTTSLIADFYEGEERTNMMGLSNAIANLGGIVASLTTGWLAIYNWRYVFSIYSISIVVFILVLLGLPEPPKRKTNTKKSKGLNRKVFIIAFFAFLLNIAFYAVVTNISLFIKNEGIGNSGYSGLAMSSLTLAGFISGISLQKLASFFKGFKTPLSLGAMSLGFYVLSSSNSIIPIILSTFMVGFGLGILKPLLFLRVTEVTPTLSNAFALSIISSSILLGKFASPFILEFLGYVFGDTSIRFTFSLVGYGLAMTAIIVLLLMLISSKIFKARYSK